jgi:hypothetical protein
VSLPFSGDGNTINGCYSSGGALKVLTPSAPTCPSGYVPIHWNVTGPKGDTGATGPAASQIKVAGLPIDCSAACNAGNTHLVEVSCPSGSVILGGGGLVQASDAGAFIPVGSYPAGTPGWHYEARFTKDVTGGSYAMTVFAVCSA